MVVNIDASRFSHDYAAVKASPRRAVKRPRPAPVSECVTIGLLNNMAGAAFKATERQFVSLLNAASDGIPIHLSFYTLPGMKRTETGGQHFASHYAGIDELKSTHLDGLIVTGREPKMADLRDEPYWQSFTEVLEWARTHTHSTVWSCLAAHAAILHMDGIGRRRSEEKNFGIFACARASEHPLIAGVEPRFQVPHSRWNGVAAGDLNERGYNILSRILSRVQGDGVDTFVKQQEQSLFVFFQGHLEYESGTLMREYRRDVLRYATGEAEIHPVLPSGYFDAKTEAALRALRAKASTCRNTELAHAVRAAMENARIENAWQSSATRIYRNWLAMIAARKAVSQGAKAPLSFEGCYRHD